MKTLTHKEVLAKRETVIPELESLEKKHGSDVLLSAMRKFMTVSAQTRQRRLKIQKLRSELREIESTGKPI